MTEWLEKGREKERRGRREGGLGGRPYKAFMQYVDARAEVL
jgi:hypothetical protein